jgi:hypothetical protein
MAAVITPITTTLFDAEESLTALLDSAELVSPEQEAEFLADFEAALTTAADKRDRVAGRLARLEAQQAYAAEEIKRLQTFKASAAAAQARLENYVAYVIERMGKDAKGKYRVLEGNTSKLVLRNCPPSVEVVDESAVPQDFRTVTVTLPAATWEDVLHSLPDGPFRDDVERSKTGTAVDKAAVKATIQAGETVSGARLVTDKRSVTRR